MGILDKITKKIGELLSGEPVKRPNVSKDSELETEAPSNGNHRAQTTTKEEKKPMANSVETREKIKKATLALLDSLYLSNSESCKTKHLIVWLDTDTITFNSYSDFGNELENYWMVESGYMFDRIELKHGKPENEQDARKVDVNIGSISFYIQEQEINPVNEHIVKRASISIFGNKGSMLKEEYELSSEVLEKERRKYYNIGRGEFPDVEGGSYRQNHIAIDDKNNLEYNKFVSRAHARIGYAENVGFYLQVEMGGSRLSGNRTRIFRGEDKIEVENIEVKEPLRDGDLIELGKAVVLKYNKII